MKRTITAKKIMSLILSVLMIATCFAAFPFEAFAADQTIFSVDLPRYVKTDNPKDYYYYHSGMGLRAGTTANGNEFEVNSNYNTNIDFKGKNFRGYEFHFLDADYKTLAYCIEPGEHINKEADLIKKGEDSACDLLVADALDNNTYLSSLTSAEFKTMLRKVLGYGYQHGVSFNLDGIGYDMRNWTNIETNTTQRDCVCYAVATQILVWEVVLGERDAQFNHVDVYPGYMTAYDHFVIYDHDTWDDNPLKGRIDYFYNQIVENVKNSAPGNDENISGQTFTLKDNSSNSSMDITIQDPNGLLKDVNIIEGIDGDFTTYNNNSLTISIPYRYAKEGTYEIKYSVKYKTPKNVSFYITGGTQNLITATGGFDEADSTFAFTIEIPHHHEWVPHVIAPTCTTQGQTCMMCKCGDIYTESTKAALNHDYKNSAWVVGQLATCTEDGELVQICERCNTVIDTKPIPATGHNGVWIIATEATADHAGQQVKCCTVCGNKTETRTYSKHTHELGYEAVVREATCANEGLKGSFCKYCLACFSTTSIPAGHSDSVTWVTTMQPTCTEAGESSAFCGDCGIILSTKTIDATGHASGVWMTSIAPFCGLEGEDICVCDQCGETIDSRATQALSHDEGVWKTTKDPTCEFEGERAKSCTRCGQIIETESIAALGHDDGVWRIDFEATADHDGQMGRYCTRCSMVLETSVFTLHDHETGYSKTLLQPTCTADGETGIICGICNAVYLSEIIPALGHEYSAFYTQSNGTHSKSCSRCHYEYTENCEYEVIESVEATCTTTGFKTHKCIVCDYTYSDSFVAPYGHTMGNWSTEGKSTHMRSCTECGVMEISKHVWGEYFTNNDGDILEEGSKTRFCIYCAESQTIGKPAAIIENALRTTVSILEFLVKLFGMLKKIFAFFS